MNRRSNERENSRGSTASRRISPPILAVILGCSLAMHLLARETITITASSTQPRAADATINQASPNTNITGNSTLTVESRNTNRNQRALIEFDFSTLPNVGIKAATMTLQVTSTNATAGNTRTYGAYGITSYFHEPDVTYNTRVANLPWGAAGGDIPNTATGTAAVSGTGPAQFTITSEVQNWYNGSGNYGMLIRDQAESAGGGGFTTTFGSIEGPSASAPQLSLTFVQNIKNLTAAPGNGAVTLNWVIPSPIGTVNPGEAYKGVLILRRLGLPVDKGSVPTDTVDPLAGHAAGSCVSVGNGQVIFDDFSGAQTYTDNAANDPCGAPVDGSTYFYKVFLRDAANFYSDQPITNGSTYTEEISATPNTTAATQESSSWVNATFSTDLAAPSLFPGSIIIVGSGTNLLFGIDPNTGLRKYLPISLGGPVDSRSPIIDAADSSLAENVIYVADNDGLVYAVATDTGQVVWVVNPTGATTTNNFVGSSSVELKSLSGPSFTPTHDLVVLGTNNAATTKANQIVALDGNNGTNIWTLTGNSGISPLDVVTSTPLIDYVNGAIWVTSHSACGATQPSLWKLSPNSPGNVLFSAALGDMDVSPSLTFASDVLFAANGGYTLNAMTGVCSAGNSTLFAINPVTGATLSTFTPATADGAITGFPLVLGFTSPYTIVYSGAANVHIVQYNKTTNKFTSLFTIPIAAPSAPIGDSNLTKVYVGSSDGFIHEIDLPTGTDDFDMYVNTINVGSPAIIGNVSLDLTLSRVYIATTDQRSYGFAVPF
jgi:outer membrane protein assembly factor BamB